MGKYNVVGNANGGFVGSSSFKPIAGQVLRNMYIFKVNQAKVGDTANLVAGQPVKLTNANGGTAGAGLSPNVLLAENITDATDISGFVVESPSDVLEIGGSVPKPQPGQIVNVALLGSGIEIYLPCDDTLQNVNINSKASWDKDTGKLKKDPAGTISILGGVVDGIVYNAVDASLANTQASKVVKVRL